MYRITNNFRRDSLLQWNMLTDGHFKILNEMVLQECSMPVMTHKRTSSFKYYISCGCLLLLLNGCSKEQVLQGEDSIGGLTPRQAYAVSLEEANLDHTALGQAWFEAGEEAIDRAVLIQPPFREVGYMDPKEVTARGYRVHLQQGQQLSVKVSVPSSDSLNIFIDLYELPQVEGEAPRHVATADSSNAILIEPKQEITYLICLQPELLRGGKYTIDIKSGASLGFPVAGRNTKHIFSFWGASRDGGRRTHEGVDIFAEKGTPVIAISDGYISRIEETMIGGKVIWVRDAIRNQAYYYAHLDEFMIEQGARVEAGDTLGTVGNTGNARNTPSHLHFGIYHIRRPKDPLPFIHNVAESIPSVMADTSQLGQWVRITSRSAALKNAPYDESEVVEKLPRHTALLVVGGISNWYYVQLPNEKHGFVPARYTEEADAPIRNMQLAAGQSLKYRPSYSAVAIDSVGPNSQVPVFGEFRDYVGVTSPNGRTGWIIAMD